jgi:hypothetical protein
VSRGVCESWRGRNRIRQPGSVMRESEVRHDGITEKEGVRGVFTRGV